MSPARPVKNMATRLAARPLESTISIIANFSFYLIMSLCPHV
jgi:hypothetical protein